MAHKTSSRDALHVPHHELTLNPRLLRRISRWGQPTITGRNPRTSLLVPGRLCLGSGSASLAGSDESRMVRTHHADVLSLCNAQIPVSLAPLGEAPRWWSPLQEAARSFPITHPSVILRAAGLNQMYFFSQLPAWFLHFSAATWVKCSHGATVAGCGVTNIPSLVSHTVDGLLKLI